MSINDDSFSTRSFAQEEKTASNQRKPKASEGVPAPGPYHERTVAARNTATPMAARRGQKKPLSLPTSSAATAIGRMSHGSSNRHTIKPAMERVTRMRSDGSVVTTLNNEADRVIALLNAILGGTASPTEVIVADRESGSSRRARWVLIPIATLNGLVVSLPDFLSGRASRKRAERQ